MSPSQSEDLSELLHQPFVWGMSYARGTSLTLVDTYVPLPNNSTMTSACGARTFAP
jgi:hypothetical protein